MKAFRFCFALCGLTLIMAATAFAQPDSLWSRTYGGSSDDRCYSMQQTSDGGYILGGCTYSSSANNYNYWLVKADANGDSLWSRTFGGNSGSVCESVQQTTDGGYILAGSIHSSETERNYFWLVKTNANGDSLWSRTFGGNNYNYCKSVQQTSDGGYILGGYTDHGVGQYDFWLVKTNVNGDSLWSRSFGGSSDDICYTAQQTSDGGYILGGYTWSYGAGQNDFWLVKVNANGDSLWSRTFGGSSYDGCYSVQQITDGGYILGGGTYSLAANFDFWLVKINANGDSLWSRTFGGDDNDICYSVQQTPEGGYILGGYTESFGAGQSDYWLVRTDSNGNHVWNRTFGGNITEECWSVRRTTDGGYVLGGYTWSYGVGQNDFWLVKIDREASDITVDPTILNFSEVFVNDSSTLTLNVMSVGLGDLIVTGIEVPEDFRTDFIGPQTIPSGENLDVQVTFQPSSEQHYVGILIVISDAPSNPTIVALIGTGSLDADEHVMTIPDEYYLGGNYPNPFNASTQINFDLAKASHVSLKVFDLLGRDIAILVDDIRPAGTHSITFDGTGLPSGVYLYRLQTEDFTATRKMMLLK